MGEHVGAGELPDATPQPCTAAAAERAGCCCSRCRAHGSSPGGGAFIESYIAPDMHMRPVGETVGLLARPGFEFRDVEAHA